MTEKPSTAFYEQGGLRRLAEALLSEYGRHITCASCPKVHERYNAFCLDEGGKRLKGGEKRRQFRCRNTAQRKRDEDRGCPTLPVEKFIRRAFQTIGFMRVDEIRRETVQLCQQEGQDCWAIQGELRGLGAGEPITPTGHGQEYSQVPKAGIPTPAGGEDGEDETVYSRLPYGKENDSALIL